MNGFFRLINVDYCIEILYLQIFERINVDFDDKCYIVNQLQFTSKNVVLAIKNMVIQKKRC